MEKVIIECARNRKETLTLRDYSIGGVKALVADGVCLNKGTPSKVLITIDKNSIKQLAQAVVEMMDDFNEIPT